MGAEAEIAEIARDPQLRSEALALLPALMLRASPCGSERVRRALQPLLLVYGASEATKAPAFWEAYYRALDGLPVEALDRGIADYTAQADAQFFPKPGPLRALCDKYAEPIFKASHRAKRALELPAAGRTPPTEEEKAAVQSLLRGYQEKVAEKRPASVRPAIPAAGGIADERGVTPQMRELLARQRGEA